jgi:hypothetical protein
LDKQFGDEIFFNIINEIEMKKDSKKEIIVISVGGSLIVPDKIDTNFIKKFKEVLIGNQDELPPR